MSNWKTTVVGMLIVLAMMGCGVSSSFGGNAGATPGGVQDLKLARAKVDAGTVPDVADLPYEGLFSEHDLPVDGALCGEVLCVRAGAGVAPDVSASVDSAWVQLGLASGIDLATFKRQRLNAAVVLDNSGSMGTDRMEAAKAAVLKLIDHLDGDDLLTIVIFDDTSRVLIGPEPVTDREKFRRVVRPIKAEGGTCIECGLRDGFARLERSHSAQRASRVFLLTDAQPNVGATGEGEFTTLLESAAAKGLSVTVLGVGLDFGQELTSRITKVRGANAVFLATDDDTRKVFDEDFDFLVTPVAYGLSLTFLPTAPLVLGAVYGVPGEAPTSFAQRVETVFLSRRGGAIVARLDGALPEGGFGEVEFSYTPAEGGAARTSRLTVDAPAEPAPAFTSPGTRKAVALTRMLTGLRVASAKHKDGQLADARASAAAALALIEAEAAALGDPALDAEVAFARAFHALLGTE
jgi:Ca-activated chloride channel family protein